MLTWGAGSYGNLGHGDNTEVKTPKLVESLLGKPCISVACGSKHTLALTAYGAVFAWGYGGGGRLGCGDTRGLFRPKLVEYLKDSPCILIAAGESHSMCISVERGQCYTWGVGDYGKLGHGDTTPQLLPRHLEYFRQSFLTWVSGGTFHSVSDRFPPSPSPLLSPPHAPCFRRPATARPSPLPLSRLALGRLAAPTAGSSSRGVAAPTASSGSRTR